jgi:hypothetical protein
VTSVEDFRRVKFRTIAIRGQDDIDGGRRYADEPIDLAVATQGAQCGQPMSPVR